jgi:CRISPR/Cas system Type II protein with McrA/HNH and RuvC-like nuclease domain
MSDQPSIREVLEELKRQGEQAARDRATRTTRLRINKRTHRIRFEHETEDAVEIVVEPLDTPAKGDEQ